MKIPAARESVSNLVNGLPLVGGADSLSDRVCFKLDKLCFCHVCCTEWIIMSSMVADTANDRHRLISIDNE